MEPHGMHVLEIPNENWRRTELLPLLLLISLPYYFKFKTPPTLKRIFTVHKIYYTFSEASSSRKMMFSRLSKSEK